MFLITAGGWFDLTLTYLRVLFGFEYSILLSCVQIWCNIQEVYSFFVCFYGDSQVVLAEDLADVLFYAVDFAWCFFEDS